MIKRPGQIFLVAMCLFLLVFGNSWAAAQKAGPFKVSALEISIMPEYDNSDVLVLYGIDFVNNSAEAYTGQMRFRVPTGTTNNIVKEKAAGNHVKVTAENKEGYSEFVWQPTKPIQPNETYSIHLEYYYNPLPATGQKQFTYKFTPDWTVDQTSIYILQPLKAEGFKVEPAAALLGQDSKGFSTYKIDYSSLQAGKPVELKVSYTKNDPNPSVQPPSAQQSAQFTTQPLEEKKIDPMAMGTLVIVVISAVVIVGFSIRQLITDGKSGNATQTRRQFRKPANTKLEQEKRQLRQRLLDGEISEDTYHVLLQEIEEDYR